MKKTIIIVLTLLISTQTLVGQNNIKRANNLFEKRAYIDAAELFLKEENKSQSVLEKLGDCYYFNIKMEEAVQWYKVLLDKHSETVNSEYFFKYSQALKGIKDFEKADKWFKRYVGYQLQESSDIETISFFETLNRNLKKSYIIHSTTVNTPYSDFGVAYYGNKIIFASTRNNDNDTYDWNKQPFLDLFQANLNATGDITNVEPFGESINTEVHEANAIVTKDGKTMYFTRNNFLSGKKKRGKDKVSHLKIYKAHLVDGNWSDITELPFNDDNYSTEHPALSPDEKQLYFASDMPGTIGSFDIFVVDINDDDTYSSPKNLGSIINTGQREQFPFVSDSNTIYFASDGHFGLGGLDIFSSKITEDGFSTPINLSNQINSNLDDFAFIIDAKSETGYFSSNRVGGVGDDDIYRFTRKKIYYLNGVVKDKKSLAFLSGTVVNLYDKNHTLIEEIVIGDDGKYSFEINTNSDYTISASKKLYIPQEIDFSTDTNGNINKDISLLLESYSDTEEKIIIDNGKLQLKINPIYFDFDKWNIRPDAALELDNIVVVMKKYPKMKIEVGAHTDYRGNDEYNVTLSHKRANSVRIYLISQGIPTESLISFGYGETQPLNECIKDGICSEERYAINRRCEFVILD